MIHKVWRLSEDSGADNLGLVCTEDGLMLGATALIERRDGRFVVRERGEIEQLLRRAYGPNFAAGRLIPGLATVAAALNASDQGLARIAAVHLRLPDLPDRAARESVAALDVLIKYQRGLAGRIRKASPDDPKHPGWPAGTPGGIGGRFRPKDGTQPAITQQVKDRIRELAMRRRLSGT